MPSDYNDFVETLKDLCRTSRTTFKSKHVGHIFVNVKLIDAGVKPGYLWDRSPFLVAEVLLRLVDNLKLRNITKMVLSVFEINGEVFLVNKTALEKLLNKRNYFMRFDVGCRASVEISSHAFDRMIVELSHIIERSDPSSTLKIPLEDHWSVPGLYGVLLGYPVVMWLPSGTDHALNSERIVNVKVNISYENVGNPVELYSFSYLPVDAMHEHVSLWFRDLQSSRVRKCSMSMDRTIVTSSSITL